MLVNEAEHVLAHFVNGDGTVSFDAPAHIVSTEKR